MTKDNLKTITIIALSIILIGGVGVLAYNYVQIQAYQMGIQDATLLINQQILNAFTAKPYKKEYDINVDIIYQRSQTFFPTWNDYDKQTKQVKRKWIVDALDVMSDLKIIKKIEKDKYKVPKPVYRKRGFIDEAICKDLYEYGKKRREKGVKKIKKKIKKKATSGTLDKWLEN